MFEFKYYLEKQLIKTDTSNSDIRIIKEEKDTYFKVTIKALKEIILESALFSFPATIKKTDTIFVNGYQSWTDSREYSINEKLRDVKKLPKIVKKMFAVDKYGDSHFTIYDKGLFHGIDLAYLKGEKPLFIGSLNYKNAYLIIYIDTKKQEISLVSDIKNKLLKVGEEFVIYEYYLDHDLDRGLETYLNNFNINKVEKLVGYSSWYNHYEDINETIIYDALEGMDSSKYDIFQIDDGYETCVGDWLYVDKKKFPNGLENIVKKIHEKGMKAGLWLAPFAGEEDSVLYKTRPELFARDEDGNFIKAGGNWSGFYALDMEKEETKQYIKTCLEHYMEMGFDFFKLDFLYASAYGVGNLTRAERTEKSYEFLRETLKNKLILGCGAIITNCYQNFDYLRIGPDVSLEFDDKWFMRLLHRERVSTKVTLQNTIYRHFYDNKLFGNDSDVFLLRDDNIKLNKKQKEALIMINAIFGSLLMTSDNISKYDSDKQELLDKAIKIFRNATNKHYERIDRHHIRISYSLDNKDYNVIYNTKKGELTYE